MRRVLWLIPMMLVSFGLSMLLVNPAPASAIGEVTPTPEPAPETEEAPTIPDDVDIDALVDEALLDVQSGNFSGAVEKMDIVLAVEDVMQAYLIRGVARTQLGQTNEAIDDFSQAIELEPWQFDLYIFRGDAYFNNGDLSNALLDYDQAIDINLFSVEAYQRRANVNYNLGDTTAGDVDDLIARAIIASSENDTSTTFAFLDEAIATGEGMQSIGTAYYIRAITNMNNGDTSAAFADYGDALEADPDLHNIYLARGILYREQDNIKAAGVDFYNRITLHGQETVNESMAIGETLEIQMAYRRVVEISFEGEAGQVITISADDFSGTVVDPLISLLNPDGEPIAGDDDFGGVLNSLIDDFELPVDGTYTLLVSHAEGGYNFGFNGIIEVEISE
ncbi:MAG: tetratricopeptide repeat protein [Anaerolineae bacterium]